MAQFKNRKPKTGYSRPQATAGQEVTRHWQNTKVRDLQENDIIAGMGVVKTIFESCDGTWYIEAGEATEDFFEADLGLLAFVKKGN